MGKKIFLMLMLMLSAFLVTLGMPARAADGGGHLARITAGGTLRVCIWPDYFGISYRNPKSGEVVGIDDLPRNLRRGPGLMPAFDAIVPMREMQRRYAAWVLEQSDGSSNSTRYAMGSR